ncbi:hypothetical protein KCP73_06480 [Salmonella enterica subsp. enterica]|nr:hypothetical protein KCP73_06480 [Salmonella enterica subsp. enterica]
MRALATIPRWLVSFFIDFVWRSICRPGRSSSGLAYRAGNIQAGRCSFIALGRDKILTLRSKPEMFRKQDKTPFL